MPFRDPFADQYGPRVLGDTYKPPPKLPESLVRAMKVRIRREVAERAEGQYIPDPEENDQGEWARVDLEDIYGEPEPETGDELTPEQRQVLRDL